MVITLLWLYVSHNFSKIMGFESPEPLANLYSRSYFRATWITTALDAGFWTAMKIRPKWLKDIASIVFTAYYLIAAEQADEKVRRVRATLTLDHLRVSWNKANTPYLFLLNRLVRPRYTKFAPRQIRIPRPRESSYREPVNAWLYFDGTLAELREQTQLVLDIPGGGYIAMNPRTADDKLLAWAGRTGVPILSLDYKKAPEFPYPYALNECFDVYRSIVASRGRCVGFNGGNRPHIIVSGDSAGGNLATGMTIMILQSGRTETRKWLGKAPLPPPDGLVLIYPSLDMNIGSWMSEEQMSLIQDRGMQKTNENVLRRKCEEYSRLTPKDSLSFPFSQYKNDGLSSSPVNDHFSSRSHNHEDWTDSENPSSFQLNRMTDNQQQKQQQQQQPTQIKTRIAVSSMISYFADRILTPEMMRAMIILYIGPHNRPDFKTDFLLSPILAPDAILASFPKTYFITGERDPLVDDTVIFAGRIRQAKLHRFRERQDLALEKSRIEFNEKDYVEVNLIPGISHGFVNFPGIFPDGWKHIHKCAKWIGQLLEQATERDLKASCNVASASLSASASVSAVGGGSNNTKTIPSQHRPNPETANQKQPQQGIHESRRSSLTESSVDEDHSLEMSVSRFTPIKNTQHQDGHTGQLNPNGKNNNNNNNNKTSLTEDSQTQLPSKRSSSSKQSKQLPFPLIIPLLKPAKPIKPSKRDTKYDPISIGNANTNADEVMDYNDHNDSMKSAISENGKTVTRLPSEEDLIGRRMNGFAGGLMGLGEILRTP